LIEWDSLTAEMIILGGIIYFSVYLEHWTYKRWEKNQDVKRGKNIIKFVKDDLEQRLHFIDESEQFKDYKPFFTDMWDAVIFSGNHPLISLELFRIIQRAYSWMKYYNSELDNQVKSNKIDEKVLMELLGDVRKSIHKALEMM
jgi:hypothetical protein